jgi:hypothetical protein
MDGRTERSGVEEEGGARQEATDGTGARTRIDRKKKDYSARAFERPSGGIVRAP